VRPALRGLYAIADTAIAPPEELLVRVGQALRGGARLIQLRDKRHRDTQAREQACALLELCRAHSVPLLINDDVALAAAIGADGVHIGRADAPLAQARAVLGPAALIGVSCYDSLERARAAARGGADYVAFGRFYPSSTKPEAVQAPPELLGQARQALDIPLVAIGGITPENGAALIEAGADMLAVIHGVFAQADPEAAARRIAALFGRDT
jgi:thiamine-phosphate pyrophosphorylase